MVLHGPVAVPRLVLSLNPAEYFLVAGPPMPLMLAPHQLLVAGPLKPLTAALHQLEEYGDAQEAQLLQHVAFALHPWPHQHQEPSLHGQGARPPAHLDGPHHSRCCERAHYDGCVAGGAVQRVIQAGARLAVMPPRPAGRVWYTITAVYWRLVYSGNMYTHSISTQC